MNVRSLGVVALVAATLSACGGTPDEFQLAFDMCGDGSIGDVKLDDDGSTLAVDTMQGGTVGCVLTAMDAPDSLRSQVETTTAMMGRQTATEDGFNYSWSYHPDNGMNMTITEE